MKTRLFFTAMMALGIPAAHAVTLTNMDKETQSVFIDSAGRQSTIRLKQGEVFDSKGKDATITFDASDPVTARGAEQYIIKGNKLIPVKRQTEPNHSSKLENPPVKTVVQ